MTDDLRLLIARRDNALNRLRVISEARASGAMKPDRGGRSAGTTSRPPPGVNLDRIRSQQECPDKDRSLFEFYAWHFTRCCDADELVKLCFLAERDAEERTRTGVPTAERHRARNRSILSTRYVDQKPEVVAACEDCTEAHVRKHRRANGLNPKTGRHERP